MFWCTAGAAAEAKRELAFLTWADYLDPSIVPEFEAHCGCKLTQVFYETDDARDNMLLENDGAGYDVVIINGVMLHTYQARGWLAPLEERSMPNVAQVEPKWRSAFAAAQVYAVPCFWGTMGIAYRKDLVAAPISRWCDLLRPQEALRGKIAMIDSARDLLTAPLKCLGASLNGTDSEVLHRVRQLLLEQKPFVGSYSYVALTEKSSLVSGDVVAAIMFNGDALMVKEHEPNIEFVLPEEGGQLWVDYLTVMARSHNKDLAVAFIDFLNRPEIAARNAQFVHYATPNRAAAKLLPAPLLADPVIYPDAEALKHSEYYARVPPRTERTSSEIFTSVVD